MLTQADIKMKATDTPKTHGSLILFLDGGKAPVDSSHDHDCNDILLIPPDYVKYSSITDNQSFMQ